MDFLAKCGSKIIILINTLFGVIGLGFLVLGLILRFADNLINSLTEKFTDSLKGELESMSKAANVDIDKFLENFDLRSFLITLSVPLIVLGVVLLTFVVVGYCGACCKSRWLLITYSTIVSLLLATQIAGVVMLFCYRDVVDDQIKPVLKKSLASYKGDQAMEAVSVAWNAVMIKFHCCGVENYEDFDDKPWKHQTYGGVPYVLETPLACCSQEAIPTSSTAVPDCAIHPNQNHAAKSNADKGCYDAIWDEIQSYKGYVIGALSGIMFFQFLLIFFSAWIAREIKKDSKVEPF